MRTQLTASLLTLALLVGTRAAAADSQEPVITHTPITKVTAAPIKITAKITDESKIFPQVFHRYGGKPYELPIDLKHVKGAKDQYEATLPFEEGELDYYIECYDEFGNGPARAGSLEQPFRVQVGEPKAAASAAAAGGGAAGAAGAAGAVAGGVAVAAASKDSGSHPAAGTEKPGALDVPSVSEVETAKAKASLAAPVAASASEPIRETPANAPAQTSLATHLNEPPAPLTAKDALWRSALLPGWGQWQTDRKVRGALFGVATGGMLVTTIWLAARASEANNIYESAPPTAQADALAQARSYTTARNVALGITLGLWAANVLESYLLFGTHD